MFSTRTQKVIRDIAQHKGRTALVIAAIAVGIVAVGSILSAYSVITREMARNYDETNPASVTLYIDSVDESLVAAVEARPEFAAAEARRKVSARLVGDADEWTNLSLVVVNDFSDIRVSRFTSELGSFEPARDQILIERASLDEVPMSVGDALSISMAGEDAVQLEVAGLVHDPGGTPAWMTGVLAGYITPAGLTTLGLEADLTELQIITDGDLNRAEIRAVTDSLVKDLEAEGFEVTRVVVPEPGEHPAAGIMTTMLFLLQAFGLLALLASAALVATLISAQMKQQRREIGTMKALGAGTKQIAGLYLSTVGLLSVAALAIGIPLGILGGRGFILFTFGMLNFEVASYALDWWVIPSQIAAALLIPVMGVMYPVLRDSKQPVRELLDDNGASKQSSGDNAGLLGRIHWMSRSLILGMRNAFRTKSRTLLTALAVAFGGAAFMVAMNTGVAWDKAVETEFEAREYALEVQLSDPYSAVQIEEVLADVTEVESLEMWSQYRAAIELDSGGAGTSFDLLMPPTNTEMISFPLMQGRWLQPGDNNAIVITQVLKDPAPKVGSTITIEVEGTYASYEVVGQVRQLTGGQFGVAYVSNYPSGVALEGLGNQIRVASDSPSAFSAVEVALSENGIVITNISTAEQGRESLDDHLLIIVGLLMIMAALIAIVGGLGLIEAMGISVLERRREIGVMRAVGASTGKVLQVVIVEGVVIAALSWVVAIALSIPATLAVENITGNLFIQAPLETSFSTLGMGIWLAVVVILATVASAIPALEVTESPVNQALPYE